MKRKILMSLVVVAAVSLGGWLVFGKTERHTFIFDNSSVGEAETEANTIFAGVQGAGENVSVLHASLVRPGFVVVMEIEKGIPGEVLGVSDYLSAGAHNNISIALDSQPFKGQSVRLIIYADDGNRKFAISRDMPALSISGAPVFEDITLY